MRKNGVVFLSKRGGGLNRRFRLRKNESEAGGGGAPADAGAHNAGGNAGDSTGSGGEQNNNGQDFDASSFWADPAGEGSNSNNNDGGQNGGDPNPGSNVGAQIKGTIEGFTANQIFTADVAQQISEGNLEGVNANMNAFGQQVLTQAVGMVAHILKAYEAQTESRFKGYVENSIQQNQTNQSDEQLLASSFPSYASEATRPVVKSVFAQSLKHSNGNRAKAVEMTRSMLQAMGQTGGSDFGFDRAAQSPNDFMSDGASSLVADLLASG